jgi:hypothetical protein
MKTDKATKLKMEIMGMLQTGKTTSTALRSALNSEGWRLTSPQVCSTLEVMRKWGWTRVAETKRVAAGNRKGERPMKVWEARRDVPTAEDVMATKARRIQRRRKRGSMAYKLPDPVIPRRQRRRLPKVTAHVNDDGGLVLAFEAFTAPAAVAEKILALLKEG